jgi:haloalkane dehalogenase
MVSPDALPGWLRAEYPFTPRRHLTAEGHALSYLDEGPRTDEAVLMVHGNPTWSYYYRNVVRALAPGLRCVVPDHLGMGLSAHVPGGPRPLERRIEDLAGLVDALGLRRVHLVVHDWGGAIGMGWAVRQPERVGRIVVLNTAAFRSPRIPARIALCRVPGLGALLVRGANGFAWPATWMAVHRRPLAPAVARGYLWPYRSWADRAAVHGFVRDIPLALDHPSWPALVAVEEGLARLRDHPMEIHWGGRDFCFNDSFLARWRELFPRAAVNRIADAGHYVLEDALEEIIPRIRSFLSGGS